MWPSDRSKMTLHSCDRGEENKKGAQTDSRSLKKTQKPTVLRHSRSICSQDVTQKPGQVMQYYPHATGRRRSYTPTPMALRFNCSLAPSFVLMFPLGELKFICPTWGLQPLPVVSPFFYCSGCFPYMNEGVSHIIEIVRTSEKMLWFRALFINGQNWVKAKAIFFI